MLFKEKELRSTERRKYLCCPRIYNCNSKILDVKCSQHTEHGTSKRLWKYFWSQVSRIKLVKIPQTKHYQKISWDSTVNKTHLLLFLTFYSANIICLAGTPPSFFMIKSSRTSSFKDLIIHLGLWNRRVWLFMMVVANDGMIWRIPNDRS